MNKKSRILTFIHTVPLLILLLPIKSDSISLLKAKLPDRPIIFVIDASGSMSLNFGGMSRLSAAQLELRDQLARLSIDIPIGLVSYGNGILGCDSARLYAPIRPNNHKQIKRIVASMLPAGNTPLAETLRLIGRDIVPLHQGATVIVITDGAESCGGNPVLEATRLRALGVKVNIIGLSVKRKTEKHLKDVARAGNGTYFRVKNKSDLRYAFNNSLAASRAIKNRYLARKWGIEKNSGKKIKQPQIFSSEKKVFFRLTDVKKEFISGKKIRVTIAFVFRQNKKAHYYVSIKMSPLTFEPGKDRKIDVREKLLAIAGDSFYNSSGRKGEIELEITSKKSSVRPIYFQGELWNVNEVPRAVGISNSLPLH